MEFFTFSKTEETTQDAYKKHVPMVTLIACFISVVLYVGINMEGAVSDWDIYKKWGGPSVIEIFSGSYWGLISSNFLHTEIWHIGFNIYWLWLLGRKIEFETNKTYYGLLILTSALVSSAAQLSFSDSTGIGLSGIVYAFFGFILVKSKTTEEYKNFLDKRTVLLFLFWLVFCVFITEASVMNIGNAAHIGGLLWGMILAYISKFRKMAQWSTGIVFLSLLTSMIFWSPFSTAYLMYKSYELHKDQKIDEAILVYNEILERDADNEFASGNLKQLELYILGEKAVKLHSDQKYNEARKIYNEILLIDYKNEWAKENLKRLPLE